MNDFKVGDKVQLKTGGPEMTVTAITNPAASKATVEATYWHQESGTFRKWNFPPDALQRAS